MPRVKRAVIHLKKRRTLRRATKGFRGQRKNSIRLGRTAATKAGVQAYAGRKQKKRTHRALWQVRINAAIRPLGSKYSILVDTLKKRGSVLDRKVLAELAVKHPETFAALVKEVIKK